MSLHARCGFEDRRESGTALKHFNLLELDRRTSAKKREREERTRDFRERPKPMKKEHC